SVNLDAWVFDSAVTTALADLEMLAPEGTESLVRILASESLTRVAVSTGNLGARFDRYVRVRTRPETVARSQEASAPIGHVRPALSVDYVEPTNDLEKTIAEVWQELLGLERIGIHDDFYELGGHSLLATQIVSRLRDRSVPELSLKDFLEAATIARL